MTDRDPREGVVPHPCPWCSRLNNAARSIRHPDNAPKPGDVSVCWYCTGVAVFTDELTVREPTVLERAMLLADPYVTETVGNILLYRALDEQEPPQP